ncbi:hypothetical protein HG535_0G05670 [Zygotorulaspora mrakii]|uniref:Thiamine transporter n=1 Tax=Zygotorulaspora mrakii TaxID=42260 RepID=A0A7H9B8W4_ZYGMR|nr:uncharacterized protein HG535_0G05670 [Zygotorulaspora mrakii]QLG74684.1 hypothetical protein HG535_0G05670 [Zygotorulaspora mrakii]
MEKIIPVTSPKTLRTVLSPVELDIILSQQEIEAPKKPKTKFQRFLRAIEVPHGDEPISVLRNPDLQPIPDKERTWGFWSFFAYWGLPNFSVATFSTGSALLSLNLNIQQSIGALVIANILIGLMTIANSNPGIKYHIGYTLDQRMIFGIYGSFIGIIFRVGLAAVFYGYLSWLGGLCFNMVFSSFSLNFLNMKNTFPESVPMTRRDLISFLCFQLIQMPFAFVKPRRVNIPSIVTCFMTLFAIVGILAYLVSTNGGPGPLYYNRVTLNASERSWMWIFAITIWYSGVSPAVANQSDYSRFAHSKTSCYWGLFLGTVLPGTFVSLSGMLCASACKELYGVAYWTPDEMVAQWLRDDYSSKARAAAFFIGISFVGSQLFLNMTQNGYSCGMDLAGILPKYINIKRGTIFVQLISWVVQPWTFFNTSSSFLDAMSAFGVFTTPIIAINIVDFYAIRKSKIPLIDFFTLSKSGLFWYDYGINWRSTLAFFTGLGLGLPGLVYSANDSLKENIGMMNFYYGYMFFIPIVSGGLYYALNLVAPLRHEKLRQEDPLDYFNCFNEKELENMGMDPNSDDVDILDAEIQDRSSFEVPGKKTA